MQKLQGIEVVTETPLVHPSHHGNALPILHEILYAMQKLISEGESTTIDLRAIPFGPDDEQQLLKILGCGEIEARLNSLGTSEIWESKYQGVWIIEHKNTLDERIALQLEVTHVPKILHSQASDISDSISRLNDQLSAELPNSDSADAFSTRRRNG